QVAGGLFQAQAHACVRMLLAQLEQPFPQHFGSGVQRERAALAGAGVDEVHVGLAIGPIQAEEEVKRRGSVHAWIEFGVCCCWFVPQAGPCDANIEESCSSWSSAL